LYLRALPTRGTIVVLGVVLDALLPDVFNTKEAKTAKGGPEESQSVVVAGRTRNRLTTTATRTGDEFGAIKGIQ
jgi:hypothetical protein